MYTIIKNFTFINIKNLLFFSILLSLINLSLILRLYLSELGLLDGYNTILPNSNETFDSLNSEALNNNKDNKDNKDIIPPDTSIEKDINITLKDKNKILPWAWIGFFTIITLGFYFFCNYYPNEGSNIKEFISSVANIDSISQPELAKLSSDELFDKVINKNINFRNDPSFNLVRGLLENKNKYLSSFREGSEEYLIEKVKITHIKNAIFKAYLEGYDITSVNNPEYINRVNAILNNNSGLTKILRKHGIEGENIF